MTDCIFCKILNKEIPSYKIYEDEYTYAFLDISKDAIGHTLVIPKKHFKSIFDIDQLTLSHLMNTVKSISEHYKTLGFEGVNIINNSGECAEQSIHHIHFHIIPRKKDDNLRIFPALTPKEIDLEYCQKTFSKKSCH